MWFAVVIAEQAWPRGSKISAAAYSATAGDTQAWEMLYDVSSFTRASFEALQVLRTDRFTDAEVYALVRLCLCVEEPLRSRARKLLRGVVRHRCMSWPSATMSLSIPMLAHDSFARHAWLRKLVIAYKPLLVPFHLPSSKVREVKLPSCQDFLHSTQTWDKFVRLHGRAKLPCPCEKYRDKLSDVCLAQGHVVAGVELLAAIHPLLEYLGSANSSFLARPS